ncbi:hypothetical protein EVAR_92734_1 [Eumeta japonica]|uniref:Uncharacterized protein n=1 Tax=Eumeta variegata TaxID=151549 RepID=A0A4C1SXA7_EUMVA|nr:hypothetical protein EVAR_92734_1 [Eumeta japonica]
MNELCHINKNRSGGVRGRGRGAYLRELRAEAVYLILDVLAVRHRLPHTQAYDAADTLRFLPYPASILLNCPIATLYRRRVSCVLRLRSVRSLPTRMRLLTIESTIRARRRGAPAHSTVADNYGR